jgi:WD40 repeat protein
MVVSADDKGKVKLWDFRTFTCLQTVDFSDKTVITNLLDMVEIGKIGVFGSRVNYIDFEDKMEIVKKRSETATLRVEGLDFDQQLMEMYVFAGKTLRVLDLANGQLKHIFSFAHPSDHDFTLFRYFSCLKRFLLGNSRGEITVFSPQTGQQEGALKESHEGAVSFI